MLEGRDVAGGLVYVAGAGPLQRDATTLVQGPEKKPQFLKERPKICIYGTLLGL